MSIDKGLEYYAERLGEASNLEATRMMYDIAEERLEEARSSDQVSGEQLLKAIEDEDYWYRMAASAILSDKIIEINIIRARLDQFFEEEF